MAGAGPRAVSCSRSCWADQARRQPRTLSYNARMTPPSLAQQERATLCDLFVALGSEAPTLCEGWLTADLAAHLVVRERRPDSALGILGGPLSGYSDRVRRGMSTRTPYPLLVETIRSGPPRLSIYGIPGVD